MFYSQSLQSTFIVMKSSDSGTALGGSCSNGPYLSICRDQGLEGIHVCPGSSALELYSDPRPLNSLCGLPFPSPSFPLPFLSLFFFLRFLLSEHLKFSFLFPWTLEIHQVIFYMCWVPTTEISIKKMTATCYLWPYLLLVRETHWTIPYCYRCYFDLAAGKVW